MPSTEAPDHEPSSTPSAGHDDAAETQRLPPGLTLVATPIGHLGDISSRAIAALREADLILCEDTRTSSRLLQAHDIRTRTESLHDHNEAIRTPGLLLRLREGARIALISDAGTPLVSDPGYRLVREAIAAGVPVSAVPGPNAAVMALVLSGLPPQPFLFLGFPPPRSAARLAGFQTLRAAEQAGLAATLLWHEAPHRLLACLVDLLVVFGDRDAAVARELTKRFEEVRRGTLSALCGHFEQHAPRGEITVVLGPAEEAPTDGADLDARLREALVRSSPRDAAAMVAAATGLPRKVVYARAIALSAKG